VSERTSLPAPHHIGYVVDDLQAGVARFAATHGAGPFFAIEHLRFDEVSFLDGPAVYDHSSAFAQWGPRIVELTQVQAREPEGLRQALVAPGRGVGHLGFLCDSLAAETARLVGGGYRAFHAGRSGPVSAVWLDGGPLGHPVEILERCPELEGFYAGIAGAASGWDGRQALRPASDLLS
jgi:catechol 2,3-dioxygenase-like lactoylglutathione lyase family enzyme